MHREFGQLASEGIIDGNASSTNRPGPINDIQFLFLSWRLFPKNSIVEKLLLWCDSSGYLIFHANFDNIVGKILNL